MNRAVNFFVNVDPKESSEKRVARFRQWYNRSRMGNLLKSKRYRKKPPTRRKRRDTALSREKYRAIAEKNKYYQ